MRSLASIQTVNAVEPIPNADAIEKIRVLGWWVVAKKGEHVAGDKLVYCEIDSLLPERPEFEFLRASSFKPNTVEIGASHSLLLPCVCKQPGQQGGCDSHASRTMCIAG